MPSRDGGLKKRKSKKWRNDVKHAVDVFEVEVPVVEIAFDYLREDSSECLAIIDRSLHEGNIPYSIQSMGKTSIHGLTYFCKYLVTCSEWRKDRVISIIKDAGGVIEGT